VEAAQVAAILDLKSVFIFGAISNWPVVGEKRIGHNSHPLTLWRLECDAKGRPIRRRNMNQPTALLCQGVNHEIDQRRAV
jgi:hypothetical protein